MQSVYYAYDNVLNSHAGQALLTDGTTGNDLRYLYTSQEYNVGTGLYNFGGREYDPDTARFLQQDPSVWGGLQWNLSVYVGNNPVNYTDPSGRVPSNIHDEYARLHFLHSIDPKKVEEQLNSGNILNAWLYKTWLTTGVTPDDLIKRDIEVTNREQAARNAQREADELKNDLYGLGLDIVGAFDQTGTADVASGLFSLSRGNIGDACISFFSVLPAGDLIKVLKLEKYAKMVTRGISFAVKYPELAKGVVRGLEYVHGILNQLPLDKICGTIGDKLRGMRDELTAFFKKQADDAAEAAGKKLDDVSKSPEVPTPEIPDELPNAPKTNSTNNKNLTSEPDFKTGVGYGVNDPPVRIQGEWLMLILELHYVGRHHRH